MIVGDAIDRAVVLDDGRLFVHDTEKGYRVSGPFTDTSQMPQKELLAAIEKLYHGEKKC
jgi:hypothetical protein